MAGYLRADGIMMEFKHVYESCHWHADILRPCRGHVTPCGEGRTSGSGLGPLSSGHVAGTATRRAVCLGRLPWPSARNQRLSRRARPGVTGRVRQPATSAPLRSHFPESSSPVGLYHKDYVFSMVVLMCNRSHT